MPHSTIRRRLLYGVAFISLSGCTYGFWAQVSGSSNVSAVMFRDSEVSTPNRGNLAGSIGTDTLPGWEFYDIRFRSTDNKVRGIVSFRSEPPAPLDWDEPDWKGRVFSVALPPGEYKFYIMTLGSKRTGVHNTEISLPFQVKRDEVVYVGQLKWSQTQREFIGLFQLVKSFRPDPASFSILDRATRDIQVIRERYPETAARPLRIEVHATDRGTD